MIVKVTKKHIQKGVRQDSACCPIALALQDAGFTKVSVGNYIVTAVHPSETNRSAFTLSKYCEKFMNTFDDYDIDRSKSKPFSFRIKG
jgi:hypothetical protein